MKKREKVFLLLTGVTMALAITTTRVNADWKEKDGKWWYTTPTGYMTDWAYLEGDWYCFDEDGWMQTGWQQKKGKWFYFEDSGEMVTGWHQIGNQNDWFYFEDVGEMRTRDFEQNGIVYHFDSSGRCSNPYDGQSFTLGVWNGHVFTNSLLNLKFTFPEDSEIVSKEEMQEQTDIIINDGTGVISPELVGYPYAFDFWVILKEDDSEAGNFLMMWEDTVLTAGEEVSAESYADVIIQQMLEIASDIEIQYIDKTSVQLGGQSAIRVSIVFPNINTQQDYYIIKKENYIAQFIVTYNKENTEKINKIINSITAIS